MLCPKDGKACCDDLCHGSGCLQMDGCAMLAQCDVCGGTVDEEIPDCSTCTCDENYGVVNWCEDCGLDWCDCECSLEYPTAASHNTGLTGGYAAKERNRDDK